jgi:C4-dicarboxylate transporter/malic acid transport protein
MEDPKEPYLYRGATNDELRDPKDRFLKGQVPIRERIHHFTWAWYTLTMSTGGFALLLSATPYRFRGLDTIGEVVFILDMTFFVCISAAITTRFILFPATLKKSFSHNTERLFFATFWLSISNMICNIQIYGGPHVGPWLPVATRILFWIYCACTFLVAVFLYFALFTGQPFTLQSMTSAWILPIFPVMLSGTLAQTLAPHQPPVQALPIIVTGLTFQGLGFMVSIFIYANYIGRLMMNGLPAPDARPGMFIAVGPPSFTGIAFIGIANAATDVFPPYRIAGIADTSLLPELIKFFAVVASIFLWALALWFFAVSVLAILHGIHECSFHMTWWAIVFPNVGFTIATIYIGSALESEAILWIGSAMTICIAMVWCFVAVHHVRAVWRRQILWPGKDEDSTK